jgi:RNA polymerase sigma-70 factor (ECF subfamily)
MDQRVIPIESINELSFPGAPSSAHSAKPSEIEHEVMRLFDRFRDPLLRYALSFGLSLHDAEEVTQEVFLSLFRHLQMGRSRSNLRGWIFRVAHNLALKQRYANKNRCDTMEPSETDQNCIRLRAEGLRYREIAAVLGISLGTVSTSLTRSIARLIRADGR